MLKTISAALLAASVIAAPAFAAEAGKTATTAPDLPTASHAPSRLYSCVLAVIRSFRPSLPLRWMRRATRASRSPSCQATIEPCRPDVAMVVSPRHWQRARVLVSLQAASALASARCPAPTIAIRATAVFGTTRKPLTSHETPPPAGGCDGIAT